MEGHRWTKSPISRMYKAVLTGCIIKESIMRAFKLQLSKTKMNTLMSNWICWSAKQRCQAQLQSRKIWQWSIKWGIKEFFQRRKWFTPKAFRTLRTSHHSLVNSLIQKQFQSNYKLRQVRLAQLWVCETRSNHNSADMLQPHHIQWASWISNDSWINSCMILNSTIWKQG